MQPVGDGRHAVSLPVNIMLKSTKTVEASLASHVLLWHSKLPSPCDNLHADLLICLLMLCAQPAVLYRKRMCQGLLASLTFAWLPDSVLPQQHSSR